VALLKMHLPGSFRGVFRVIREGKFFPSPAKSCFQMILFHAILHAFNLILLNFDEEMLKQTSE